MGKIVLVLVVAAGAVLLRSRGSFEPLVEWAKSASDVLVSSLLRTTSQFESELTEQGREEQRAWREQRLRDLKGLAREA